MELWRRRRQRSVGLLSSSTGHLGVVPHQEARAMETPSTPYCYTCSGFDASLVRQLPALTHMLAMHTLAMHAIKRKNEAKSWVA